MKFSALINNFNYVNYLDESVESTLAQSYPPSEVILVDDGSTDNSRSVGQKFAETRPTLNFIAQENKGQLSAIRTGIEAATGDWCAFLDSDDIWRRDHLAVAMCAINCHPDIDVHYGGHQETAGPPRFRSKWREGVMGPCAALVLGTQCRIGTITSALIIRTSLAKRLSAILADIEDAWRIRADDCLLFGAAVLGARFHYDSTCSVNYRIHGLNHFAAVSQDNDTYKENKRELLGSLATAAGINPAELGKLLIIEAKSPQNQENARLRRHYVRAILRSDDLSLIQKAPTVLRAMIPWQPG